MSTFTWRPKYLLFVCFLMLVPYADAACDLPFYYNGVYVSAQLGELTANSSMIARYPINPIITDYVNFGCKDKRGDTYLLRSTQDVDIFGAMTTLYLCLEIHQVTNSTYYYYHGTGYDRFLKDYIFGAKNVEATFETACTTFGSNDPRTFFMMVKSDALAGGFLNSTCPQDILAVYADLNITTKTGIKTSGCQGTTMDVCTDRSTMAFTYNSTCSPAKMLSSKGKYSCLYSMSIGSNKFLGVWNQDTTVDGSNTFRFACFAYTSINGKLYLTETPNNCTSTTTPTNLGTATKGTSIVAWDIIVTCPDTSPVVYVPKTPVDLTWLTYLAVGLALLLLFILTSVIAACIYKKYGCICKRAQPKLVLSKLNIGTHRNTIGRQESQDSIINDETNVVCSVAHEKFSNSSNGDILDIFKPKKSIDDVTKLSAVWKDRQLPVFVMNPKVGPMYTDTVENYLTNGIPRSKSRASLFRLDSGVFDEDLEHD